MSEDEKQIRDVIQAAVIAINDILSINHDIYEEEITSSGTSLLFKLNNLLEETAFLSPSIKHLIIFHQIRDVLVTELTAIIDLRKRKEPLPSPNIICVYFDSCKDKVDTSVDACIRSSPVYINMYRALMSNVYKDLKDPNGPIANDVTIAKVEFDKLSKNIQSLISTFEESSAKRLSVVQQKTFESQAKWDLVHVFCWVVASIISLTLLYNFLFGCLRPNPEEWTGLPFIQYGWLASKILFGSVLCALIYSCIRGAMASYNAHILNKHRKNAFSVFDTLRASGKEDQVKDAITKEAARCIFAMPATGLVNTGGEKSSGDGPHNMIFNQIPKILDKGEKGA